ncbi:MAG: DUF1501 domain-containing protein [Brevirhabdus sp.]
MNTRNFSSRRAFLKGAATLGCSAAAHPLLTSMTLASAPWENRLVVIILRGAMDGLDVVQPYGDPKLAAYRRGLKPGPRGGAHDLDGFYALHPSMGDLMPLWQSGELAFAHAVSTPYRDKRSHFDGQDMLEAGTGPDVSGALARQGWLNRMLQTMPGVSANTAFAIGRDDLLILDGDMQVNNWSPATRLDLSPQSQLLLEGIYHEDPLFRDAALEAFGLAQQMEFAGGSGEYGASMKALNSTVTGARKSSGAGALAAFAADRLRQDTRIAAFSITGWDTHRNQTRGLNRTASGLADAILTLKEELGALWSQTTVLAMTEFGRTARENGSKGTDHGTGGAMLMAGGTLSGAKVHGRWPGLSEADLYARRDLMPTADVRSYAGWVMHDLFGLETGLLEGTVFPGLDLGDRLRVIA